MTARVAKTAVVFPGVELGSDVVIEDFCLVGKPVDADAPRERTVIGDGSVIRAHTTIYAGVTTGARLRTGDKANIRGGTRIGDDVSIGAGTVVEHSVTIGDGARIHSQAFIPEHTVLEAGCWIGPRVTMTNAKYPRRADAKATLKGPRVEAGAIVGANATLLPGITVAARSLVGAGAVVTKSTEPGGVYVGSPAARRGTTLDVGYAMPAEAAVHAKIPLVDLGVQMSEIRAELDAALAEVVRRTTFVKGPACAAFEQAFGRFLGEGSEVVGCANGTDALEVALRALELPAGSEVIVPANSFVATAEAVTWAGHRVVFCDVEAVSRNVTAATVRARLTPRTKALVVVHLYGQPAEMDELQALCREKNVKLVEDCAQAHGARFRDRRIGTFGDVAAFSFFPTKPLGALGDAGAVVTRDAKLARFCRMFVNHGRLEKYDHALEGRNSRLDEMQAAALGVKLPRVDGWNARRQAAAAAYERELGGVGDLVLPRAPAHAASVFHLYVVRTARREALAAALRAQGIDTGVHYPTALHELPFYASLRQQSVAPVAARLAREIVSLPMGEHVTPALARRVAAAIKSYFAQHPATAPLAHVS
jgi:dTDP-4-amino-4,6-dideoxygalactose transaminase/acetyltransferase-like isoleucine patch superfamily enzyme